MAIEIRAARPEDAPAIAAVHLASARDAYREILPDDWLDALSLDDHEAFWRSTVEALSDAAAVWVAADSGGVIGFCTAARSDEPDAIAETAEIGWLYVSPERAGQGVGGRLLAHAVAHAVDQGFAEATLWVYARNERARRFYESAGWQTDGAEKRKQRGNTRPLGVRYRIALPAR
ncbi:MAG TPA: N-acetyltransferase [Dehalococcoidia bacterium]